MTLPSFRSLMGILLIGISVSYGQTNGNSGVEEPPKVYIDGHDYPSFGDGSHYAWFEIHFPLTETSGRGWVVSIIAVTMQTDSRFL